MPGNPFLGSTSKPGYGTIDLIILPPSTPIFKSLKFQYPLKLISPSPIRVSPKPDSRSLIVHTVFLLTYGGGLVAGDTIHLDVTLAPETRLCLLTQGSTKIFITKSPEVRTFQHTLFDVGHNAGLVYLADPVQPFESSNFEQRQTYTIAEKDDANLCVCDWVSQGRTARGEDWSFRSYVSRNEVWMRMRDGKKRLMLRDNLILDSTNDAISAVARRMDGLGIFGTLILRGTLFEKLGEFFMSEFKLLPQMGGRQWDEPEKMTPVEEVRATRVTAEKKDQVLWTAASLRGFVVVKFGAKEVEGAKRWLNSMLKVDGTVEREFGERALLCLR